MFREITLHERQTRRIVLPTGAKQVELSNKNFTVLIKRLTFLLKSLRKTIFQLLFFDNIENSLKHWVGSDAL